MALIENWPFADVGTGTASTIPAYTSDPIFARWTASTGTTTNVEIVSSAVRYDPVWETWADTSATITTAPPSLTTATINSCNDTIWKRFVNQPVSGMTDLSFTNFGVSVNEAARASRRLAESFNDAAHSIQQLGEAIDRVSPDPNGDAVRRERLLRVKRNIKRRRIRRVAERLLREVTSADEFEQWVRHGSIRVRSSEGKLFEVNPDWEGHLYELHEDGTAKRKLCVHPDTDFPVEDRVAALILNLRTDESYVLGKANEHRFDGREALRVKLRRRGGRRAPAFAGAAQFN